MLPFFTAYLCCHLPYNASGTETSFLSPTVTPLKVQLHKTLPLVYDQTCTACSLTDCKALGKLHMCYMHAFGVAFELGGVHMRNQLL